MADRPPIIFNAGTEPDPSGVLELYPLAPANGKHNRNICYIANFCPAHNTGVALTEARKHRCIGGKREGYRPKLPLCHILVDMPCEIPLAF